MDTDLQIAELHVAAIHLSPLKGEQISPNNIRIKRIIPLETNEQSLIVRVSESMILKDRLYVMDRRNALFKAFDLKDNYLFEVGAEGKD